MKILSAPLVSVLLASSLVLASDHARQVECQCMARDKKYRKLTSDERPIFSWCTPFTPDDWYHEAITAADKGDVKGLERIIRTHAFPYEQNPLKYDYIPPSEDLRGAIHCILEHLVLQLPTKEHTPACILAIMKRIAPYACGAEKNVGASYLAKKAAQNGHKDLLLPLFGIDKDQLHSDEFTRVLKDRGYDITLTSRDSEDWKRYVNGLLRYGNKIEQWANLSFPSLVHWQDRPNGRTLDDEFDSESILLHIKGTVIQEGRERLWKKRILYTLGACAIGAIALYLRAYLTAQTPMVEAPAGDGAAL